MGRPQGDSSVPVCAVTIGSEHIDARQTVDGATQRARVQMHKLSFCSGAQRRKRTA
jgi:hypothetical protein